MNAEEIRAMDQEYVLGTYARAPFVLERGQGCRIYDSEGKAYLDFVSGIAVNALGYGDPDVLRAIAEQSARLIHVSNLYLTQPQAELAKMLVERSFADKVYFCNSGAEATEGAVKFARKWARTMYGEGKTEILTFSDAFHGRTFGALALTPRAHYQDPFRPLMPGAKVATFNDLASAQAMINDKTCACIVEPIQGEGGVNLADPAFMRGLREMCDRQGVLLIFDEVQCGLGRTGTLWAHEQYGVTPDMMTLAKPLAGGLPMGAVLMTQAVADVMAPGDHGSTFAATPLVAAVANVVVGKISDPAFLEHVRWAGSYLQEGLGDLQNRHASIQEVRGRGLIWGVATDRDVTPLLEEGYAQGLLTLKAGAQVLRLLPPLTVDRPELDEALGILDGAFTLMEKTF
jgi:acetylornithine/N-succinyldiaminopimelate aminotransferase